MNPDAVHQTESEHDYQYEGAAIADQRQRHACDWQHCDRHSHVLKDVREDKRRDTYHEKES